MNQPKSSVELGWLNVPSDTNDIPAVQLALTKYLKYINETAT